MRCLWKPCRVHLVESMWGFLWSPCGVLVEPSVETVWGSWANPVGSLWKSHGGSRGDPPLGVPGEIMRMFLWKLCGVPVETPWRFLWSLCGFLPKPSEASTCGNTEEVPEEIMCCVCGNLWGSLGFLWGFLCGNHVGVPGVSGVMVKFMLILIVDSVFRLCVHTMNQDGTVK